MELLVKLDLKFISFWRHLCLIFGRMKAQISAQILTLNFQLLTSRTIILQRGCRRHRNSSGHRCSGPPLGCWPQHLASHFGSQKGGGVGQGWQRTYGKAEGIPSKPDILGTKVIRKLLFHWALYDTTNVLSLVNPFTCIFKRIKINICRWH